MDTTSKKYNPRKEASWVSLFLFHWLNALMWKGFKQELKHEDLYVTPEESSSQVLYQQFDKYWTTEKDRIKRGLKPRLWFALFQCLKMVFVAHGVLFGLEFALLIGQGILVGYLSEYFCTKQILEEELSALRSNNLSSIIASKQEEIDLATRDAYLYASGMVIIVLTVLFVHAWAFYYGQNTGMQLRIITIGAIYKKVLKLSHSTIGQLSIGYIVNLASNDVQRFDLAFLFIHESWVVPVFLPVFAYFLWRELGPTCLVTMAAILLLPPIQFISVRMYTKWRFRSARVTDKRVRVMNEIISGMRLIKMYAWEWAFHEYVKKIRKSESRLITQASMIRACNLALFYSSLSILSFLTFSVYTGSDNTLTSRTVFTVIALISFGRLYFVHFFVIFLLGISELRVGLKRIETLLLLPELGNVAINDTNSDPVNTSNRPSSPGVMPTLELVNGEVVSDSGYQSFPSTENQPKVSVNGLTASWTDAGREKLVLDNISFDLNKSNRLLAVVGPVGSGKSSLLQCLLRELQPLDGSVDIEGTVSYASQEPWIFSGTLKENILFGRPFDQAWFDRVVECCSLVRDFEEMPFGEETLIGERGVNLSGGQKARVNLARAVYRDSDIMLLDDPLSAVDAAVSRHLFDGCICGVLADKLVILVTHQLQYAQHANSILVLKEGCVRGYGNYEELTSSGVDPTELFDDVEEDSLKSPTLVEPDIVIEESEDVEEDKESIKSPDHIHLLPIEKEAKRRVRLQHPQTDDYNFDSVLGEGSVYTTPSLFSLVSIPDKTNKNENVLNVVPEEERAHGTISNKTYYIYLRQGASALGVLLFVAVFLFAEVNIVASDWWLSNWTSGGESCATDTANSSINEDPYDLTTNQRIAIYAGIVSSTFFFIFSRTIFSFIISLTASRHLHNQMFKAILRSPVLFFDTNPVGRVLNRFSKDIGFMDDVLPFQFLEFFSLLLRFFAIMIVACIANYWLFIPAAIILAVQLAFRWFFLHTSRHVKRLEALARSPLFSHISSTIQGLSTIRSYKEEEKFYQNFFMYQDEHTRGWHTYITTNRWFGMRIDVISAIFLVFVVFGAIPLADSLDPGLVGLSLAYSVTLTGMFQYCVRVSAEVENLLVSVERVMAYSNLESEGELETIPKDKGPSSEWPEQGGIELHKMKFKYAIEYPYVLKSLSLTIKPSEKIGIVGRTGAGKSSLLSALFRLAEPEGVFEIDGIQITDIGLHDLRKKISIIPQDPVLFSGTVRYNLDPFDEYQDHQMWDVLEEVQLKEVIANLDNGLEAEVSESGSNFSVGQRQLMCLARALLRRNKILVIDEATANVDLVTDGIIQEMIRNKFNHCTILTIAHRLETIMDSDRVLVLSSGKVIEFDTPYNLLQKHHSVFHSMVKKTGPTESQRLKEIAATLEHLRYGTRL